MLCLNGLEHLILLTVPSTNIAVSVGKIYACFGISEISVLTHCWGIIYNPVKSCSAIVKLVMMVIIKNTAVIINGDFKF